MTAKALKSSSVQRVITFRLIEIIHVFTLNKRMPDSNRYIHVYTNKKKDEQTSKFKRKKKKKEMLLDPNPHLLSAKDSFLSIRLSRNCEFFIHKRNCATI